MVKKQKSSYFGLVLVFVLIVLAIISFSYESVQNTFLHLYDMMISYLPHRSYCNSVGNGASLCTIKDGTKFYTFDHDIIISDTIRAGLPWEHWMHRYFAKYANKSKVSLDIGANIGAHTVYLSKYFQEVHAFEPQKRVFDLLSKNTAINNVQNAKLYNIALGNKEEILYLKKFDTEKNTNQGGIGIVGAHNQSEAGEKINSKHLDSFGIDKVGLIKIDVEGFEYQVLRGGYNTIKNSKPIIIIEIHPTNKYNKEIRQMLAELGYELNRISHSDFIAVPKHFAN